MLLISLCRRLCPAPAENSLINLSDVLEDGRRVVLYFYPAAMTPGCTTEACDFRDNLARLESQNVAVLGVSRIHSRNCASSPSDHLTFPLLSDPDLTVHKLYGAYGEKKLYGKIHVGVIRSTLVINPDGSVVIARYNVRAEAIDSLLKALEKLEKLEK
ncbi:MAG: peroxiredoxin [Bifidobacterium breve]